VLREVGQYLVDIHGQSEHLSLLRVKEHINLLDRYADLWERRGELARSWRNCAKSATSLRDCCGTSAEMARRVDLLQFQIEEINSAKLKPGEDATLEQERTRLANAEQLAALADEAYQRLTKAMAKRRRARRIAQASKALTGLAKIDPTLSEHLPTIESATAQLDDLARTVRAYRERIEFSPSGWSTSKTGSIRSSGSSAVRQYD